MSRLPPGAQEVRRFDATAEDLCARYERLSNNGLAFDQLQYVWLAIRARVDTVLKTIARNRQCALTACQNVLPLTVHGNGRFCCPQHAREQWQANADARRAS